ncbi:uncharacterized protein DUF3313 [Alteromonadaceae bacterium 2753L.S.0a.02]|nr:uncharacterized protein DUF3313 [Alteromonadaceae bacterium 2753L.S.0a.02]
MKYLIIALMSCLAVLSACSNKPSISGNVENGMQRVKHAGFGEFYIKSGIELNKYSAISYAPLKMENLKIDQKRVNVEDRNWDLTQEDIASVSQIFAERVVGFYQSSRNFKLLSEPAPNALTVSFELLEFVPTASKDSSVSRTERSSIFTKGIGRLHATAKISDAVTGELLATLEDDRDVGNLQKLEENKRVRNERKLRLHFDAWLSRLDEALAGLK